MRPYPIDTGFWYWEDLFSEYSWVDADDSDIGSLVVLSRTKLLDFNRARCQRDSQL